MGLLNHGDLVASFATLSGQPVFRPSRYPFADRVAAAAGAGFVGIGMSVDDFDLVRSAGLGPEGMREILDEHRIEVREVEGIGEWLAVGRAAEDAARRAEERVYELVDLIGGRTIAPGVFTDQLPPLDLIVERFGALCDRAGEHGLTVAIEPVVLGPLQTVAQAAEVVAGAARPNGGMLVDSYHFFRAAERVEALGAVAAEQIVAIHLADAAAAPDGTLWDDCLSHRNIPGQGELPVLEFLLALDRCGVDAPLGIEVFSTELWPLAIDEVLQRVATGTRELLSSAGVAAAGSGSGSPDAG